MTKRDTCPVDPPFPIIDPHIHQWRALKRRLAAWFGRADAACPSFPRRIGSR